MTTAGQMGDRLDALSAFLDSSYEPIVRKIMDRLSEIQMPHSYDAVLILVNDGISLFDELINSIGENEGFVSQGNRVMDDRLGRERERGVWEDVGSHGAREGCVYRGEF